MKRIADPDEARDSIVWIATKQRDDKTHPWWVMELLACSYDLPDSSISPRVYGACMAKCLTNELAQSIARAHTTGQLVVKETRRPWPSH